MLGFALPWKRLLSYLSFFLPTFPCPLSCKKPRTHAQQQRLLDPRIKDPVAVGFTLPWKRLLSYLSFSLPTFSQRKKLNVDTHTSVALVSCMSSSRLRHWKGCVSQAGSSQVLGAHLSIKKATGACAPFNQEGNFVRTPLSIKKTTLCACPFQSRRQLCVHALFNMSSNL